MKTKLFFFSAFLLLLFLPGCASKSPGTSGEVRCAADLKGASVAVLSGSANEIFLMDSLHTDCRSLSTTSEILLYVASGKADYGFLDQALLLSLDLSEYGCKEVFRSAEFGGDYCFGFRYGDDDLYGQFLYFFDEIKSNGLYDEILERWTGPGMKASKMPHIELPTEGEPLKLGYYHSDFPFSFVDDSGITGLEPEILTRFAAYLGRPVKATGYEFQSLIPALNSLKEDIIAGGMFNTEERSKKVHFSPAYYHTGSEIISSVKGTGKSGSFIDSVKKSFHSNLVEEKRWKLIVDGLRETVVISIFAILLGTLIGALVCFMRMSRKKFLRGVAVTYLELLRGIPMLVFLMIMFYVVLASAPLTATWVAIIAFAMNFGAFVSEIFRSGINSVDKGQVEAGLSIGFTKFRTFIYIVLPQAVKTIVPVFKNEAVSLLKNTSIVGYIAIQDLTKMSDLIRSRTFDAFFPLIIISIIYFILAWLLGKALDALSGPKNRLAQ